jgi:hypothetical protein
MPRQGLIYPARSFKRIVLPTRAGLLPKSVSMPAVVLEHVKSPGNGNGGDGDNDETAHTDPVTNQSFQMIDYEDLFSG